MAPTVGYLVCWAGPRELLEINVRNHKWALQDFSHEIFVGCRSSQRNRCEDLPNVKYLDRDTDEYEFTLGHYLPGELLKHDVVVINQLDQYWSSRINENIEQVFQHEEQVFVRDNDGYRDLKFEGRTYPRLWEGGLIVNANLVRRWQADGILMSRLLKKATADCEDRNRELCEKIRAMRPDLDGRSVWCPDYERWDVSHDFGSAVQHWLAIQGIMPVAHKLTTHFQGVEISLRMSGNDQRSLARFSMEEYLSIDNEFYLARWPMFVMFLVFAGYRLTDEDRARLMRRFDELPRSVKPGDLKAVRNEVARWHTELDAIDEWIDYFENGLLPPAID